MITPRLPVYLAIHLEKQNRRLGIVYVTEPIKLLLSDYMSQYREAGQKVLDGTTLYVLYHAKRGAFEKLAAEINQGGEGLSQERRQEIAEDVARLLNEAQEIVEQLEELAA